MNLLTFDFGGTSVKYTLWQSCKFLEVLSFPTPKTWEATKEKILEIKAKYAADYSLSGATFSFPGCVDKQLGEIRGYSAINYIHHFPIQQELTSLLELPIALENDANCAALAEVWTGVAKGVKNVLFVVVGTGVGGAFVVDGKIHPGSHLYCGEFGFMFLAYDHNQPQQQNLSELGTAVKMAERYCQSKGVPKATFSGQEVFELAKQNDIVAIQEVEKFFQYLSIGIFNLQTSFDPEVIVIGGGISASPEIIAELEKRVNSLIEQVLIKDFKARILPCHYKNDANLLGAVKNFYNKMEAH